MILILVVALFAFGECTGGEGYSGVYSDYRDVIDIGGNKQYDPKVYLDVIKNDDKKDGENDKNDGRVYLESYKGYDNDQKYEGKKESYNEEQRYDDKNEGYNNEQMYEDKKERYIDVLKNEGQKEAGYKDEKDRYDDKKYSEDLKIFYGESKFEKYDGPKDYLVTDKNDRYKYNRRYYYRGKGSDLREYDYVPKCDTKEKDCQDGKDCYDKAKDRNAYDTCRGTYGNEDRYYDEQDRYNGDRYRFDYDRDGYEYEKECYDNTKDRNDYDKCRRYYKKCSEYEQRDYKYSYNEDDWRNDKDCYYEGNLVGLGRNGREDQLIRPCALDDRQCIRKYFAQNSNCKPAYGPIPDPLYLKRNTVYMPFANVTMIKTRLRVTGLSSIKITEFYINKDTKNLVIAFDFTKLNQTSPKNYFRYKRTAKESIVLNDYTSIEYNSGTFTAVIPKIPHLRLDLAEVHADIDDLIPLFFFGPGVVSSTDPDVITGFARLGSNFPVFTQELFLLQAQLFTAIYIQENICDFGLKLISV